MPKKTSHQDRIVPFTPASSGTAEAAPAPAEAQQPAVSPAQHDASLAPSGGPEVSVPKVQISAQMTLTQPEEPKGAVIERLKAKAQEEAENGSGATKGRHPYEFEVRRPHSVPAAFLDVDGSFSADRIDEHLQRCWDIDTTPSIEGLIIGRRVG